VDASQCTAAWLEMMRHSLIPAPSQHITAC